MIQYQLDKRLNIYIFVFLILSILMAFFAIHALGLIDCPYCVTQRWIIFALSIFYLSIGLIKPCRYETYLICSTLVLSVIGAGVAWQHLEFFYADKLVVFGDLILKMGQVDLVQQKVIQEKLATFFGLDWILLTIPFWSLIMFAGLFGYSLLILIDKKRKEQKCLKNQ